MKNYPTQFSELNAVLDELTRSVHAILGEDCLAVYLQGSFGMGEADEHSDVDFMVVVREDLDEEPPPASPVWLRKTGEGEEEDPHPAPGDGRMPLSRWERGAHGEGGKALTVLDQLQRMHGRIYEMETEWARHLEGSYFPARLLRGEDPQRTKLWYLDNTARLLERSDHDNTLVVRWVTRQYGITLAGLPPHRLIDPVEPGDLRREVRAVMCDWGAEILDGRYAIGNRWAQPFAVISTCRMLQTQETGTIESKLSGVRWGLANLDARWHGLIERAWADRPDPSTKVRLPADPAEVEATQRLIREAIEGMGL